MGFREASLRAGERPSALRAGPLRYLFAAHPQAMGKVLGIIYRTISTHLIHKAGYRLKDGATGAVTLIQRFGSALNLNMPQGTFS